MLQILRKSLRTGIVTTSYPKAPAALSAHARGRPEIDFANWKDARPAANICPTGAISYQDANVQRTARLDLGKCIFCGRCAEVDHAIRMTTGSECAADRREKLVATATYSLNPDGTHESTLNPQPSTLNPPQSPAALESLGRQLRDRVDRIFGPSLHIREVDAGSCNGCEIEIVGLNSPVYDLER